MLIIFGLVSQKNKVIFSYLLYFQVFVFQPIKDAVSLLIRRSFWVTLSQIRHWRKPPHKWSLCWRNLVWQLY